MIAFLRYLRHGPLKALSPFWLVLGNVYRFCIRRLNLVIPQNIGPYGPFLMDARFSFSDFRNWGSGHNNGFYKCIESCRGKTCVIDVGAHIGLVSLPALSVMASDGILVAFEPAMANRALLLRHLSLNGYKERVQLHDAVVGDVALDSRPFFEMSEDTGMNSVVPNLMDERYVCTSRVQVTLDDVCAESNLKPDVIKIDVEGAELLVLRGARNVILECKPIIFLSVHPRQISLFGESTDVLAQLIESLGYKCINPDGTSVSNFSLKEYLLIPRD